MRACFADVTFDGEARLVLRSGQPVHLTPKAFALLGLLVERRPAAVSRLAIQEALWPGVFVTEGNIDSLVKEIRKALGDGHGPNALIRTVHGFGYAFDAPVREEKGPSNERRHLLVWGTQTFPLAEGPNVLGRVKEANVWLGHDSVSRAHARVTVDGDRAEVVDLGSRNGTLVGGVRVEAPVALQDGDEVVLGCVRVVYRYFAASPSTPTRSGS
ncbi:MAG: winged helix-turn-helix domain-containing protein [Thermoanaerobaculia bacterium]|nr:winged helix-turn-helix domain-containing protein [Thermoanaerobaculia bacterium]